MELEKSKKKFQLKKVEKFSLYLFIKHGIDSILKIQKILFFLRIYEKKKGINKKSPIFDKDNKNFQAWMYGPVNVVSYYFMRLKLYDNEQESNDDALIEMENMDKNGKFVVYSKIIKNLKEIDSHHLVELSHHNLEYKKQRKGLDELEPCKKELNENSKEFKEFDKKFCDEVDNILSLKCQK